MKLIQTKKASWVVAMALLATPGLLTTSCSKDNQTEAIQPKANQITFSVKGINSGNTEDELKRASVSTTTAQQKIYSFSDVDMAVSVDNVLPNQTVNFGNIQRSGGLTAAGTSTPDNMAPNVKYVVYIYSGNTLVSSKLMENGVDATIDGLNPATTYTWVALSYNTTDTDQPSLAPTNGTVSLPANKDVLYASGTVKLSDNSNIAILFNHKFARIGIELNTIGIFGEIDESTIPTADVTGLTIAGGDINLLGDGGSVLPGTVTAGTATSHDLHFADFAKVDANYNDAKIAYVYTASTAPQSAINMKVQNLKIKHVDGNLARTYYSTAANFAFNVTPQQGKSHHLLLNVIESPLVTNFGGRQVKWGRSNLYYTGKEAVLPAATARRNYAFYANNALTAKANGYFAFGSVVPGQFATTTTNNGDPCALVYPAGTWKQPAKADFANMVRGDIEAEKLTGILGGLGQVVDATGATGLLNIVTNLLGNVVTSLVNTAAPNASLDPNTPYTYGQYTLASGNNGAPASGSNAFGTATSASNSLRFYYNGQISNVNIMPLLGNGGLANVGINDISVDISNTQIINLGLPLLDSYGKGTALWTNEQGTNILGGVAGAGTWGYYGNAGRGVTLDVLNILNPITLGARFHMANNTGELLNGVSALGANVLSTSFKNVRCVRTN